MTRLCPQKSVTNAFKYILIALVLFLAACNKPNTTAPTTQIAQKQKLDVLSVDIKSSMLQSFKVSAIEPVEMTIMQEISGRIDTNERLVTRIGASVTGRVTEVLGEVGDSVRVGQTLARIASPELTTAQLAYLRANASASLAERAVERARQLIQADVIGSAELQRRESELSIARAETRASADHLRLMGISTDGITKLREQGNLQPTAGVTATQSGVITERKVSIGQVAQPGDQLFTVADLSNVWVIGALPEQAARTVQLGQKIEVNVPALGERKLISRVVFISDTISPETRSVTIRTQVDNPKRELKPQMLANLRLAGATTQQLAVPLGAVVREGDKDHVYVQTGPLRFRLTAVELGSGNGGLRPVLKGLAQGTQVVIDGAFHLNNERKRSELE